MFGTYVFADVLADVVEFFTTTGVGPLILVGIVAGLAGLVVRTVKKAGR